MSLKTPLRFLKKLKMFAGLSEEELEGLSNHFTPVELSPDENLFTQGQKGDSLYLVINGGIDIFLNDMHDASGKLVKIVSFQSGECFGESSAIGRQPRPATAKALEKTLLMELKGEQLEYLMEAHPIIAKNLLLLLCNRAEKTDTQLISYEWQANTDELTGLHDRNWFNDNIVKEFEKSLLYNHPVSLLLIEIDHFKAVEDYFGQATSEQVLHQFGKIIRRGTRTNDLSARYGDKKFAVLFPRMDANKAVIVGERIRNLVERNIFFDIFGVKMDQITISGGVADRREVMKASDLIKNTERALNLAKNSGYNCIKSLADPSSYI